MWAHGPVPAYPRLPLNQADPRQSRHHQLRNSGSTGDLNGDGKLAAVVGNYSNVEGILLGDGLG